MTQADVIRYLKKCKKPKTARQIAQALGVGKGSVNVNLRKLRETDDRLEWIEDTNNRNGQELKKYFLEDD